MTETSLDRIIPEERFADVLGHEAEMFFRLANTLRRQGNEDKRRLQTHQLGIEADLVEAFLDDHGAKNNRRFWFLRELVASVRGFARVGFSLAHLQQRLDSYQTLLSQDRARHQECHQSLTHARDFVRRSIYHLLDACEAEVGQLGIVWARADYPEGRVSAGPVNLCLPHNLGEEVIEDEGRRVAELASKYLQVCGVLSGAGIQRLSDEQERRRLLAQGFTEEHARVHEATVHNLQSTYDTHLKGSTLEREDRRLPSLRGHISASFHFLQAVTDLMHFVERHEAGAHAGGDRAKINDLVPRLKVEQVVCNDLLYWSKEILVLGEEQAREILSTYSHLEELVLTLPTGLMIHARPASLIVAIVNHHEMPVELSIEGSACNAASILEVLICAGSNPEARSYLFRGDARPLLDLKNLFDAELGEEGFDHFPPSLAYLVPGV